jgi:hypothetical protein
MHSIYGFRYGKIARIPGLARKSLRAWMSRRPASLYADGRNFGKNSTFLDIILIIQKGSVKGQLRKPQTMKARDKMSRELKLISKTATQETRNYTMLTPEKRHRHFRNVMASVLQDAHDTWGEIWNEFQGQVTEGVMVNPEAERGHFVPKCGWPEFLEKMWILKHYLDYAKRFCE